MMISTTINKKGIASWHISKSVGEIKVSAFCQLKKIDLTRKRKGENITKSFAVMFGNEKKVNERREIRDILPRREDGWKGVRRAASMGHLL